MAGNNLTTDDVRDLFDWDKLPADQRVGATWPFFTGNPDTGEYWTVTRDQLGISPGQPAEIFNASSPALSGIKGTAEGQTYTENPTIYAYNRYRWYDAGQAWILVYQGIRSGTDPSSSLYASLRLSSTSIVLGATVQLLATATSSGAPIASVAFYNGNIPLGSDTQLPYALPFTPTTAGRFALKIVAFDQAGNSLESSVQFLDVTAVGANRPPAVTLTVPKTGVVGQALPLTATAVASGSATIVKGEFLSGLSVLATATAAPWATTYTPTASGYLTLSFRATDSNNLVNAVTVVVQIAAAPVVDPPDGGGTTPVTPAPPTFADFNDTQSGGSVRVVPTAPLPLSMYVYALPATPTTFAALPANGTITVGNIAGSVITKSLAGTYNGKTYLESLPASSPAFTTYTPPAVTLTSIAITGATSVNEGNSATYSVQGTYSDGTTSAITSGITWTNAPNGVLAVPSNSTPGDGRTITISAQVGSLTAQKVVTIVDTSGAPVTLTAITVNGPNSVNEGSSGTYTATGTYSDGTSQAIANPTWSSNAPGGVLAVASNSVVGDGRTTTVTANLGSVTGSKTVTIVDTTTPPQPVTLTAITISGPSSVNEGSSGTYVATGTYSDGSTNVLSSPTWSSNAPGGVFAVASNSVVGDNRTATITATQGSVTGSLTVNIVDTSSAGPGIPGPTYHGSSATATPNAAQVSALTAESWAATARTVSFDATAVPSGSYLTFAEPASYGIRSTITDQDGDNVTGTYNRTVIVINGLNYNLYVTQLANYDNPAILHTFATPA